MPLPQKKLIPGFLLALVIAALAAPPLWWSTGNPPVINANPANNHAPANIGQAKHMAKSALDAIRPVLPAVADHIEADLVGPGKPIPSWAAPANQAEKDKNHAPLLIGQLKAIAAPFYTRLHTAAPVWLEAERIANGTNHPDSIFPWTTATTDDNNKGMAKIGQLKAVFSLRYETLTGFDSDGDSLPDTWEVARFGNLSEDAYGDPEGDGITNRQEYLLGTDPNAHDPIGLANVGFDEIDDPLSPDLSFRPENPSDLYPEDSVPHWNAAIGQHIEIWKEDDGDTYAELQSHWDAKGIEQEFDMLPGTSLTFILRYKGRYDGYNDSNPFKLKVEGAYEVRVNGQPAQTQGSVKHESFMTDDTWEQYAEWHYASVVISAAPHATTLVPITLTLIPEDTDEAITYGGFVDLLPLELTVAFGIGPDIPPGAGNMNSRALLEAHLNEIQVFRHGDVWAVDGKDDQGNDKIWVVEIVTDQAKLNAALANSGHYVVFDGHSNYGIGPNWAIEAHKSIDSFTNYGVGYTDLPITYIGDGTENDPILLNQNGGIPDADQEAIAAMERVGEQGWAYFVPGINGILESGKNYIPEPLDTLRFPNQDGVMEEELFNLKQNANGENYHYTIEGSQRILVLAPKTDVPLNISYKTFFYNACDTGPDYIENFRQGDFIYTNKSCWVHQATKIFVKGVIEGKSTEQIIQLLNAPNVGGGAQEGIIYGFERF